MKTIFPSFSTAGIGLNLLLTFVFSAAPAFAQPVGRGAGQGSKPGNLVASSAVELLRLPSLEAKIRHRVDLFGHELVGQGFYQQLGEGTDQLRKLELKLQAGTQTSTVQQVCAGRFLWTRRDLPGKTSLSRIDLRKVREALAAASRSPGFDPSANWLAIGGLPKLLHSLDENFSFGAPQDSQIGEIPVSIVTGTWKPEQLAALLPDQKAEILAGKPARLDKLAPHVPDLVQVTLGRDDLFPLFPYRIEYLRSPAAEGKKEGAGAAARPIVTLELFELRRRDDLDRREFIYDPGDQDVVDQTEAFLQGLKKG
jgi:hypothetical protein